MNRLDELRFPLDDELLLSQAALWLASGIRPLPLEQQFKLGLPTEFGFVTDSTALDALFLALSTGKIFSWAICHHETGEIPRAYLNARPEDDKEFRMPSGWWLSLERVDWLRSEYRSAELGCQFWMIRVSSNQLLSAFPSLKRAEEAFWKDNKSLADKSFGNSALSSSKAECDANSSRPHSFTNEQRRRRGPQPVKRDAIKKTMLLELKKGTRTVAQLSSDTEEALSAQYKGSRETVRKAREAALAEFRITNPDKSPTNDK